MGRDLKVGQTDMKLRTAETAGKKVAIVPNFKCQQKIYTTISPLREMNFHSFSLHISRIARAFVKEIEA